jgi:hypothetical protein
MPAQIADLLATERFRLENEAKDREIVRLRAERLTPEWMTLKTACIDLGINYETALSSDRALVEARRDGGRWIVNRSSLKARLIMLHSKSIVSAPVLSFNKSIKIRPKRVKLTGGGG